MAVCHTQAALFFVIILPFLKDVVALFMLINKIFKKHLTQLVSRDIIPHG